jgi:hypothetical protein
MFKKILFVLTVILLSGQSVPTSFSADGLPLKIVTFGDSITQGMDALYGSSLYSFQIAEGLNLNMINQGVGGYFFEFIP